MADVVYKGVRHRCAPGQTVLDALRAGGVDVPSACEAGVCQTCVLRAVAGIPPEAAQRGLRPSLRESGHFLACQCVPGADLEVAPPGAVLTVSGARVIEKTVLAPDIVRVRLWCTEPFPFRGGQFIQLVRADGLVRSFSLANLQDDGWLELHVRRIPGGRMSSWIHDELAPGDTVTVRGPAGECVYGVQDRDQPMLLVGTGTGAAPLWAITRDAFRHRHRGPITFFHAARDPTQLYLDAELRVLAERRDNLAYHPVIGGGALAEEVLAAVPAPAGFKIMLCGAPQLVERLRVALYLAGASLLDIAADPFVPAPARPAGGA